MPLTRERPKKTQIRLLLTKLADDGRPGAEMMRAGKIFVTLNETSPPSQPLASRQVLKTGREPPCAMRKLASCLWTRHTPHTHTHTRPHSRTTCAPCHLNLNLNTTTANTSNDMARSKPPTRGNTASSGRSRPVRSTAGRPPRALSPTAEAAKPQRQTARRRAQAQSRQKSARSAVAASRRARASPVRGNTPARAQPVRLQPIRRGKQHRESARAAARSALSDESLTWLPPRTQISRTSSTPRTRSPMSLMPRRSR